MARSASLSVDVPASESDFYNFAESELWGDGLPLIAPTPERVEAMIDPTGRDPDEVVGVLKPRMGVATIETIAANAVMAGCPPQCFPVVVAALESAVAGGTGIAPTATTNSGTPLLIINGPARHDLQVNFRESCFGAAGRANATIGRALRFCLINIAGAVAGPVSKSVFGHPGRYTMCIGEWDERNPWDPLHVQRGFGRADNCVTAVGSSSFINITDTWSRSAEDYLLGIAHTINTVTGAWIISQDAEITIILNPAWAELIHREGYDLSSIRLSLWENSQVPLSQFPLPYHGPLQAKSAVLAGDVVAQTCSPDKLNIIVAGGLGGLHAIACHAMDGTSVTYPFEAVSDETENEKGETRA